MGAGERGVGSLGVVSDQALYRSVVRAMGEGVVIHDDHGHILEANPAAERILGLSCEQMSGRLPIDPRWRLVRVDGAPATPEDIPSEITTRTGRPARGTLGVHRPSGDRAWLIVSTEPVFDDAGVLRLVVATFTDVTEAFEARAELELSRARLAELIDLAPGAFFQVVVLDDGRRRTTFASERMRPMFGLEPETLMAEPDRLRQRVHPEDVAHLDEAFTTARTQRGAVAVDVRMRGVAGEWLWIRVHAVPRAVPGGVAWTGILIDATREHAVAERLRQSARREAMGEMAAGLAHNFNNLLASVLPNIEHALSGDEPPSAVLPDALLAAQSAADLVRQLLALTRGESAEAPARRVELGAVVAETLRFCRRSFDPTIGFEVRESPTPLPVLGQPSNLQQVVMNLLLNARDAVRAVGAPRIKVAVEHLDGPSGPEARLVVTDNGIGMDAETLSHLGEPFFTTKAGGHGSGLGLATVFGIVRDAGGVIHCDSKPGLGSTFVVRLPLAPHAAASPTATSPAPSRPRFEGRILLVDDEPLVRSTFRRILRATGLEVLEASQGEEALTLLERLAELPSAMLLDLSMPGLRGDEVLAEVARRWPTLPVLVMTGHREPDLALETAREVLGKPIDRETLLASIGRALAR